MHRLPGILSSLVTLLCACVCSALCQTTSSTQPSLASQLRRAEGLSAPQLSRDGDSGPSALARTTDAPSFWFADLATTATTKAVTTPQYSTPGLGAIDACDLNANGTVDSADVEMAVNQVLNPGTCTDADLHLNNTCTVLDVQVIAADIATGTCLVPNCASPLTYPSTLPNPTVAPACPPTLPPNPNPPNSTTQDDGPIHPCMYVRDGVRFQAIEVTGVSGEQALNLNLYEGAACNPNNWVDQVFFGEPYPFYGNATSLYWMRHFWDQPGTSAVWTVGNITTPCIDYSKVPDCS